MSVEEKENVVDLTVLRAEIKKWENDFKIAHGRKAGRADIKGDAIIEAKYKQFNVLTGRKKEKPTAPLPPPQTTPRKTTRHPETNRTLSERPKPVATPRKTPSKAKPNELRPPVLSPVQEIEATPAYIRAALGPTPQRDGQVLGIFDTVEEDTPVKHAGNATSGLDTIISGTPSRAAPSSTEHPVSRTPQSVGKRHFLDAFAGTPLKRKRDDETGTSSALKRKFATPSFLRRSFPLASIDEETAEAPKQPPFKKRGLVRSLSSIIQGLKKQEEERMDDDWDILQEIEEEEEGDESKKAPPKVLVPESQGVDMPLGPDQGVESSDESSGPDEEAKARKPWKKKGLKRQTRRTNMKPVLHKAKKADEVAEHPESESELVAETQLRDAPGDGEDGSDADSAEGEGKTKAKKKQASKKTEAATDSKAKRKVKPEAHANYRALKIKSKNSKGKGGGRRFGRR